MKVLIATNIRDQKGLARDGEILSALLSSWGHQVETLDFRAEPQQGGFHLAIHLEHVEPRHLGHARRNWYVPNAEWHMIGAQNALAENRFERVLCKTRQAERLFVPMTPAAVFVGFESRDRMLQDVPRERVFMHAPGQSGFRATAQVLQAFDGRQPGASLVLPRAMPEAQYIREQNRCLFHLCPSELEGWGHSIHEALSVGAIVLTTDAPPMNEIDGVALRIPVEKRDQFRLVERVQVGKDGVSTAVTWALGLEAEEMLRIRAAARDAYEAERANFRARLGELVAQASKELEPAA